MSLSEEVRKDLRSKKPRLRLIDVVAALHPLFDGEMIPIRQVRGVRLKDGEERIENDDRFYILYDQGVQEETASCADLFDWQMISEILI